MAVDFDALYKQDSVDKQLRIAFDGGVITNTELHSQEFELNESLCSESVLRFGSCEASSIKFKISNVFTPLKDKWLSISETLAGNTAEPFLFGNYKVFSDRPTADRRYRDVVAYDSMYDILEADVITWYNTILPDMESQVTLKQFRDSFFLHLGIEQQQITLPNDSLIVQRTIDADKLSGQAVATAICEINGCFGHIGRDGKFQYIFLQEMIEGLYPRDNLYPADNLFPADPMNAETITSAHYISCEYEDYTTARINKLLIRQEEDDVGAVYPAGEISANDNCYTVQGNFLVYGKSTEELQTIAANMYQVISRIWYRPAHVVAKGNPCLEVGAGIRLRTKYEIVYTYILQRTLKGIQALRDTYDAEGEQYQKKIENDIREQIRQLRGKSNKLTRTLEETRSEIVDMERDMSSQISQNAQQILLKVSKGSVISEINQTAETIKIQAAKIDLVGLVNANEFVSKYATITNLNASNVRIASLEADHVSIGDLSAATARIGDLETDHVSTDELEAAEGRIGNLEADHVSVSDLVAVNARFSSLSAEDIVTGTLYGDRISCQGRFVFTNATVNIVGNFLYNHTHVKWGDITVGARTYTVLMKDDD